MRFVVSWNIHTKIFTEGFRHNIFDPEIVTAVGGALGDKDSEVRHSAVKFFIAAIAQGALCCFHRTFIPKYSQRGFRRIYLTLRSSPYLEVHYMI